MGGPGNNVLDGGPDRYRPVDCNQEVGRNWPMIELPVGCQTSAGYLIVFFSGHVWIIGGKCKWRFAAESRPTAKILWLNVLSDDREAIGLKKPNASVGRFMYKER